MLLEVLIPNKLSCLSFGWLYQKCNFPMISHAHLLVVLYHLLELEMQENNNFMLQSENLFK